MKTCIALLLLVALCFGATVVTPGYVPSTDTVVATSTKALQYLYLNNKSGSSANCNLKDRSTNCGGGACTLWGPAAVAASGSAGSIVSWVFYGLPAPSGFTWSCDVASAVVGSVTYQ